MTDFWRENIKIAIPNITSIDGVFDVAIIGGGFTGVLCALRLAEYGVNQIAVLEQNEIGSGVSGVTTGKLSAQHRLIYHELSNSRGPSVAKAYAEAHKQAVQDYGSLCRDYSMVCDYECKDSVIYTRSERSLPCLQREAEAASAAGLDVHLETQAALPIQTVGSLRTRNQAQFNPYKFLAGAVKAAQDKGVLFCEHTRVTGIRNGIVLTRKGQLRADKIIIATHYPLIDKWGWYFARLYQSRSYVLALSGANAPRDMAVDTDEEGLSFRSVPHVKYGTVTLLGGCAHKTGTQADTDHYSRLCEIARRIYPESQLIDRWSAQDCMTHDGIPFIGLHSAKRHEMGNLYVATGFNKWGMTTAMVAANMLSRMIVVGHSPYTEVFSPNRAGMGIKAGSFIRHSGLIAGGLAQGLHQPSSDYGVCPRCTHMRSALHWNKDEQTWDCPAHGSRFDEFGGVIETPAQEFLNRG